MKRLLVIAGLLVFATPAAATTSRILAASDRWPVWAPDDSHLAFTRIHANTLELWTLDLRTKHEVHIGTSANQPAPTWSPDGARLAYSSGGVLYTVNADGSGKARFLAPIRSYAPAWRPASNELAYITTKGSTNTDLWVSGKLWARDAIGAPAWSPDGTQLAFQRTDGIYVTAGPAQERRVARVANPGAPAWSREGTLIAYVAHGALFVVSPTGGNSSLKVAHVPVAAGAPSWSSDDARVSADRAWSPVNSGTFVQSGPKPGCPGHVVLLERGVPLTGSCAIVGTAAADTIEGTPLWGDAISGLAGNDRIHANDGHTDRVNCGPGRDTVWADRSDRLTGCEIIHR